MKKIIQYAFMSSVASVAVVSFAETAAAQLNVNINLGGARQPVYVAPTPPQQPIYVVQPGVAAVHPASPRSRHYRKKHHRNQPQYIIPRNPGGVTISF